MLIGVFVNAQGFNKKLEYFIDKDPGVGKGQAVSITAADTLYKSFEIKVDTLSTGIHWVHVRILGDSGLWTPYQFFQFTIEDSVTQGPVSQLEYFLDKDTSVGKMISSRYFKNMIL
jgi:hypothetical protein